MLKSLSDSLRRAFAHADSADASPTGGEEPAEPASNGHFRVLIGNEEIAIARISALQTVTDPKHATSDAPSVRLVRAIDANRLLWQWHHTSLANGGRRRRVRILHLRSPGDMVPLNVFTLVGAYPLCWTGPKFDAIDPDTALEELDISYRTIIWPFADSGNDSN